MATATAAARRAEAKIEYDAFVAACPSQKLLGRISDKWVALILVALGEGSLRLTLDSVKKNVASTLDYTIVCQSSCGLVYV